MDTSFAILQGIKTPEDKDRIIAELQERNRILEQKIDALIKILYGVKSEKIDPAQLQLLLEGFESKKPQASSENDKFAPEEADAAKPKTKRPKLKTTAVSKAGTP